MPEETITINFTGMDYSPVEDAANAAQIHRNRQRFRFNDFGMVELWDEKKKGWQEYEGGQKTLSLPDSEGNPCDFQKSYLKKILLFFLKNISEDIENGDLFVNCGDDNSGDNKSALYSKLQTYSKPEKRSGAPSLSRAPSSEFLFGGIVGVVQKDIRIPFSEMEEKKSKMGKQDSPKADAGFSFRIRLQIQSRMDVSGEGINGKNTKGVLNVSDEKKEADERQLLRIALFQVTYLVKGKTDEKDNEAGKSQEEQSNTLIMWYGRKIEQENNDNKHRWDEQKLNGAVMPDPDKFVELFLEEARERFEKIKEDENFEACYLKNDGYLKALFEKDIKIKVPVWEEVSVYSDFEQPYEENADSVYSDFVQYVAESGASRIILTGAPGSGKTRLAQKMAEQSGTFLEKGLQYGYVRFHPQYEYADFVESLCPVGKGDQFSFQRVDGAFVKFCRKVAERNQAKTDQEDAGQAEAEACGQRYFFVIDEINRADVVKVFGELSFILGQDQSGEENRIRFRCHEFPVYDVESGRELERDVFADGFYIPHNVVIIGTMNEIDRPAESLDVAFRTKFKWYDVQTKDDLADGLELILKDNADVSQKPDVDAERQRYKERKAELYCKKMADRLVVCIKALNKVIAGTEGEKYGLNRRYAVCQGLFAGLPGYMYEELLFTPEDRQSWDVQIDMAAGAFLEKVWNMRICPLLLEYVRGKKGAEEFVMSTCRNALLCSYTSEYESLLDKIRLF